MGSSREETRAFFAERAAGWDGRFPDDGPRYATAVAELAPERGTAVLDVGCGTGRADEALRAAVGPDGHVVAVDLTPEMLAVLVAAGRRSAAAPVLADGTQLPFHIATFGAVFAAGFLPHVADPDAALIELARVVQPGGRLALFHPIGRVALAGRHGHPPADDDIRDERRLRPVLDQTGWALSSMDDGPDRYLAIAERV